MHRKKLLFISANRFTNPYPVYPLGIAYLVAYLKEHLPGYEIRIFDFNIQTPESLSTCLTDWQPDYIALSLRNIDDVSSLSRESFIGGYKEIAGLIRRSVTVPPHYRRISFLHLPT